MSRRDVIRRTIAAALVCLAAASAWWRLLGAGATVGRILPAVLIVALAFAAGTAGGRRVARGTGALMALAGTFLAGLIFGAMTLPDTKGDVSPGALITGTVQGLGILLHSPVPAPVNSETVTAAIIFTGYATMIACLVMCSRRPSLSLIPAMMLFIGATALSQGSVESPTSSGVVFLLACVGAMALVPTGDTGGTISDGIEFAEPESAPTNGRIMHGLFVGTLCVLITAAGVGLAELTNLGGGESFDPHQTDNYRPDTSVNPVDQVNRWQTIERRTKEPLMTVKGTALPRAFVWTISEAYNGSIWQTIKTFDDSEPAIPYVGPPPVGSTRAVQASVVTTENLPGPWLPTAHRPIAVTGVPIRVNSEGVVIARSDKAANSAYTLASRVPAFKTLKPLESANSAERNQYSKSRELPAGVPYGLIDFADQTMSGGGSGYDRLTRLADTLSSPEYRESVTGYGDILSYDAIDELVNQTKSGTQAQFATAFAIMARTQGFATRVVSGYAMPTANGGKVTSAQAIVWAEANLTKVGWVPFAAGPRDLVRGVPVPTRYKAPPKPEPTPEPKPTVEPTPQPTPQPQPQDQGGIPGWLLWILTGVAVVAAWMVLVLVLRRRVRSRLHGGDPTAAAVGAWVWIRSTRRHLRVELPTSPRTSAQDDTASPQLRSAATIADEALYGPVGVSQEASTQAWADADAVVAASRSTSGLPGRLRWLFVPLRRIRLRIKPDTD